MVQMNQEIFREYDIRGLVEKDLTPEIVRLIGKGYGTYLQRKGGRIMTLGRDVRPSSQSFSEILVESVCSTGVDVIDLGVISSPLSYYSVNVLDVDGGVMITGSHNPPEYNGFKIGIGKTTISGDEIQQFRRLIEEGDFLIGEGTFETYDIIPEYKEDIKERVLINKSLRVAVDAGNGCGGILGPDIMNELGIDVTCLYCEPDGRFPNHHPDPTVDENLEDLIKLVKEKNLDVGIAYDGDADRIGVVDNTGRIIRGDQLVAIFAGELLDRKKGDKIIFDVKCSQGLSEFIESKGGVPVMWKTGHSLIKNKMKELHAGMAGEMSGHIFFSDRFYGFDDAIYASLRLFEIVSKSSVPLSDLVDRIPYYHSTPEIRAHTTEEDKWKIVEKAKEYFKSRYDTIDIDGVRILFGDGWGLVRASNTQPVLVLRFEAKTQDRLQEIKDIVITKLKEFGDIEI